MGFSLLLTAGMTMLPGHLLLGCLPCRWQQALGLPHTHGLLATLVSFVVIAELHLVTFLLQTPPATTNLLLYGTLVAGLVIWRRRRGEAAIPIPKRPLFGYVLVLTWLGGLLLLQPGYETGFTSDWALYYPNTDVLLNVIPARLVQHQLQLEYLVKRTPFLSLYGAFFMSFLGRDYAVFQLVCLVPNACLFWILRLFGTELFGRRAGVVAAALLLVGPALIRVASVPEPKAIASVFLLLSMYYYLLAREDPIAGAAHVRFAAAAILGVAAMMCHPSMLFYFGFLLLDHVLLLRHHGRRLSPVFIAGLAGSGALLILPWYLSLAATFGWSTVLRPTSTIAAPLSLSAVAYLRTRLTMILSTVFAPAPLIDLLRYRPLMPPGIHSGHFRLLANCLLRFYDQTFLGGLTVSVALSAMFSRLRHGPPGTAVSSRFALMGRWLGLGALVCFAVHLGVVDNKGHATNLTAPVFALYVCYVAALLSRLSRSGWWLMAILAGGEWVTVRVLIVLVTGPQSKRGLDYVAEHAAVLGNGAAVAAVVGMAAAVAAALVYLAKVEWAAVSEPEAGTPQGIPKVDGQAG